VQDAAIRVGNPEGGIVGNRGGNPCVHAEEAGPVGGAVAKVAGDHTGEGGPGACERAGVCGGVAGGGEVDEGGIGRLDKGPRGSERELVEAGPPDAGAVDGLAGNGAGVGVAKRIGDGRHRGRERAV
jgi:hypothetical protein